MADRSTAQPADGGTAQPELPPNWEAVVAEDGRTYYWNVDTNETSWVVPSVTVATRQVAASYLSQVQSATANSAASRELDELRGRGGGVAELSRKLDATSIGE